MCLAVPREVVRVVGHRADVWVDGRVRSVVSAALPELTPGDYVLLHADAAIERLDATEAREILALIEEIAAMLDAPDAMDDLLRGAEPAGQRGRGAQR